MDIKTTHPTTALDFKQLVVFICHLDGILTAQVTKAVNASLTLRNWLIGLHVEEYERRGVDRAEYGEKLMDRLSESLTKQGISRCDRRGIYRYRQFYFTYPQIVEAVSPQLKPLTHELLQKTDDVLTGKTVRDPYVFEFLGLKPREVMSENRFYCDPAIWQQAVAKLVSEPLCSKGLNHE